MSSKSEVQLTEVSAPWRPDAQASPDLLARLVAGGAGVLTDCEALALAAGLPLSEVAALLLEFGSLPEVLAASGPDLGRLVAPAAAARLALARDLSRRILEAPLRTRPVVSSSSALEAYLVAGLAGRGREAFHVLFLDRRNQLIADECMGEGSIDHAPVYPREVVRRALELNAAALILVHNHPSGDPTPSSADVEMTHKVVEAARALGLPVHDHVVVGGRCVASLKALRLM